MNEHATKFKGDLALTRVMYELSERGWYVLTPISEHLPFDLMVYKQHKGKPVTLRIQVKYRDTAFGVDRSKYKAGDFDFFAIYCRSVDSVVYVGLDHALECAISTIAHPLSMPSVLFPVYWYEDFSKMTFKRPSKRVVENDATRFAQERRDLRRVAHATPSVHVERTIQQVAYGEFPWMPAKLQRLVWKYTITELAARIGMSDVALRKRARKMDLLLPPNPNKFWLNEAFRNSAVEAYKDKLNSRIAELKAFE